MSLQDPRSSRRGQFFGSALAGVCTAVILSVPASAYTARFFGDSYETRSLIYCGFMLWVVCGAIAVFAKTWKTEENRLSFRIIFLWFASVWLWPLLLAASSLNSKKTFVNK